MTEPILHPLKGKDPEGFPLADPPAHWKQEQPSFSVPIDKSAPKTYKAGPGVAPEDGFSAQHSRKVPLSSAPGVTLAVTGPEGHSPSPPSEMTPVSSAEEQSPIVSPVPPREPLSRQLCGENSPSRGTHFPGSTAAGGFPHFESGPRAAPQASAVTPGCQDSSAYNQEELELRPQALVQQCVATRAPDTAPCLGATDPQFFRSNLGASLGTSTVSQQSWKNMEPPWEVLGPAAMLREAADGRDADGQRPLGTSGAEPPPRACEAATGPQASAGSAEPLPILVASRDLHPAPGLTPCPAAPAEDPEDPVREVVSGAAGPILVNQAPGPADARQGAQETCPADLGAEGQGVVLSTSLEQAVPSQESPPGSQSPFAPEEGSRFLEPEERARAPEGSPGEWEEGPKPGLGFPQAGQAPVLHQNVPQPSLNSLPSPGSAQKSPKNVDKPYENPCSVPETSGVPGQDPEVQAPESQGKLGEYPCFLSQEPHRAVEPAAVHGDIRETPRSPTTSPDITLWAAGELESTISLAPAEVVPEAQTPKTPLSHCTGEDLLTSQSQPHEQGHDDTGLEVHAESSRSPLPINGGTGMMGWELSLEPGQQQGDPFCPVVAPERPLVSSKNHLQTSQLNPEVSDKKTQESGNEVPGLEKPDADSSLICASMGPPEADCLPTRGVHPEGQKELPEGNLSGSPYSASGDTVSASPAAQRLESPAQRPELPTQGDSGQEGSLGTQPSRVPPPDALEAPSPVGVLSREESCRAEQGLSKSWQELARAPKDSRQHEEACLVSASLPEQVGTQSSLHSSAETNKSGNGGVTQCPSPPSPAGPHTSPLQDAAEGAACGVAQENSQFSDLQKAMECPGPATASQTETPKLPAIIPPSELTGAGTAGVGENEGLQPTAQEPPQAAPRAGGPQQGELVFTSDLQASCSVEQFSNSDPAVLQESGAILRGVESQDVPHPIRPMPSGSPGAVVSDAPYLQIASDAKKEVGDSRENVSAPSPQTPDGGAGLLAEPNLTLGHVPPVPLTMGSLVPLSQPTATGGQDLAMQASTGSPQAGAAEGSEAPVPYLDKTPLPAEDQMRVEKKGSGMIGSESKESMAGLGSEAGTALGVASVAESCREKKLLEPSEDERKSIPQDVSAGPMDQLGGFPDFREHVTKIFEKSVLGALAGRAVGGKDLPSMLLSPEKLLEGTHRGAIAPLPVLPGVPEVSLKDKEQDLAGEVEISHPVPQNPALEHLPGPMGLDLFDRAGQDMTGVLGVLPRLEEREKPGGAGEGPKPATQAHSPQGLTTPDPQLVSGSPEDKALPPGCRIPSGEQQQEGPLGHGQPKEEGTWGLTLSGALGNLPGSPTVPPGCSLLENVPTVPKTIINEPQTPELGAATGVSGTVKNAPDSQSTPEAGAGAPLEQPGWVVGAAGEAVGDVRAETQARGASDPAEPEGRISEADPASDQPGSCGEPICPAERVPGMEAAATPPGVSPTGHPPEEKPLPTLGSEPCTAAQDKTAQVSAPPELELGTPWAPKLQSPALGTTRYSTRWILRDLGSAPH